MPQAALKMLLLVLLCGEFAQAQEGTAPSVVGVRRIELNAEEPLVIADVEVSPGLSTLIVFDSEVIGESLDLEGRERFTLVDVGKTTVRLVPSDHLAPGTRFTMVVRFRDGAIPMHARFALRVHPARAEQLVEVYRQTRSVETYQQEAREARAEVLRLREENERLRAERSSPGGIAGLISIGAMDQQGVESRSIVERISQSSNGVLVVRRAHSYRSAGRVAVEVFLEALGGAPPWTAKGAALRGKSGEQLKVLQVWQDAPVPSDPTRRIVVEAETTPDAARGNFTLKLWEADGPRAITLGNVTFP